jgi:hypothetical protein
MGSAVSAVVAVCASAKGMAGSSGASVGGAETCVATIGASRVSRGASRSVCAPTSQPSLETARVAPNNAATSSSEMPTHATRASRVPIAAARGSRGIRESSDGAVSGSWAIARECSFGSNVVGRSGVMLRGRSDHYFTQTRVVSSAARFRVARRSPGGDGSRLRLLFRSRA